MITLSSRLLEMNSSLWFCI